MKGICSICGRETASFTCSLCGALVGVNCYDPVGKVCIRCKAGRMIR
ncbi:MAG: orotate phosphoribosyltransferase [Candidatus Micrarchaeia archaeon]